MENYVELTEGQKLVLTGKVFEGYDSSEPYLTFLGYDSSGWNDIWVDYKGRTVMVRTEDIDLCD